MKLNTRLIALAAAIIVPIVGGVAFATFPYFTHFSKPMEPGPFVADDGWRVELGLGEIVPSAEASEGRAFRLPGGRPPAILQRRLDPPAEADILFVDLTVRPAVGEIGSSGTSVTVGGATVGFVVNGGETATLIAREGFEGEWIDTKAAIPLLPHGRAEGFHRLTFRIDRGLGVYDIVLDGQILDYDLRLDPARNRSGPLLVRVMGAGVEDTWIDDFLAAENNPLFDDPLGSGIPAEWLAAQGIDPMTPHRYEDLDGDGTWTIEKYFTGVRPDYRPVEREARTRRNGGEAQPVSRLVVFTPLERRSRISE